VSATGFFAHNVSAPIKRWVDALRAPAGLEEPGLPEAADDGTSTEFMNPRRIVRRGGIVVIVFVIGFLGWGALAPLDSAMMSQGTIVVESHRKTIQHLEGGIVADILVTEGQTVSAGQALIRLDDTQARASLSMLQGQADALAAQEARDVAQRDGASNVAFPGDLLSRSSDPKVADAMRGELAAFTNARETIAKQVDILNSRIEENNRSIEGLRAQLKGLDTQIALIAKETAMIKQLVDRGIEALPRLLALQRNAADLGGQRGAVLEKIAQTEVNNGETQLQIVNLKNQALSDVLKDLRDVQTKRFDVMDRIKAARDVLNRQVITTPVEGRVVNLSVHTRGAVIRPGEPILDVVPQKDALEVEAHVRPEDIDNVHIGMSAKVTLSGNQARRIPAILGTVTEVSADRLVDQHSGQPYFIAQVSVDKSSLADYPDIHLVPGMPVEVAIETGQRTALDYFFGPIRAVFRKGMRER
jgi:HlyD family type I secretion membrane fusion protein